MNLEVLYPLQKKDASRAGAVLADIFQHDPVWQMLFRDTSPVQRIVAFDAPVCYFLKHGQSLVPTDLRTLHPQLAGRHYRLELGPATRAALQTPKRPAAQEFLRHRPLHLQPRRRADSDDYSVVYHQGNTAEGKSVLNQMKAKSVKKQRIER